MTLQITLQLIAINLKISFAIDLEIFIHTMLNFADVPILAEIKSKGATKMIKMDEFTKQAKDKYDELCKQEDGLKKQIVETQAEKRALKAYLVEKGIIARQSRKKRISPASK